MNRYCLLYIFTFLFSFSFLNAQLVINEGTNKNYQAVSDEDQEYPDWIELYNAGSSIINLSNFSLTDDSLNKTKWVFPNIDLQPNEYKIVFCSGKDRKPIAGFEKVVSDSNYTAFTGWNMHRFNNPFFWDGQSGILINTNAYAGSYTTNSVVNQSASSYFSTNFAVIDGSSAVFNTQNGTRVRQRPNIKINNTIIGQDSIRNTPTDYPAPYGNWYWASRHQILISAADLTASGMTAGMIDSLGFDVVFTDPNTTYEYFDIYIKPVVDTQLTSLFTPVDTNKYLHSNFKISSSGETVFLYDNNQNLLSSLYVNVQCPDNSNGLFPDASASTTIFNVASPSGTNNASNGAQTYLLAPSFSQASGIYNNALTVSINNPNPSGTSVYYTLDGSDPDTSDVLYNGSSITIYFSSVLKARSFSNSGAELPSAVSASSYLIGVNHFTPVLSVVTDRNNLYGPTGIFDNWATDWERSTHVEYFDSSGQIIFSQRAGMQIDGGWGGSRFQPQHSFRIELDDAVLGDGKIIYPLIPNRPYRDKYSNIYLRNGSNQYQVLPYKDAAQVELMAGKTNVYYSAWRPVTVYINGEYFGLYELREKFDEDYFNELDDADPDSIEIMSQSAWNSYTFRAVMGSIDSFYASYDAFNLISPADTSFWEDADRYFDMKWYNDYIIAETWMANVDWPANNIKIYRSNKVKNWRFCLIDLELSLAPNGWTDFTTDHIQFMLGQSTNIPFINIWLKGIQNYRFKRYFINRFADLMNTAYKTDRLLNTEQSFFDQTILEMPRQFARWGNSNTVNQQMSDYINNHNTFRTQLSGRTAEVRNHINTNFSLNGQVDIALYSFPPEAGRIKINTIIPDSLPWIGVYFDGNPVTLTAIANPGYRFEYWDANNIISNRDTNEILDLNVFADAAFIAYFTPDTLNGKLAISELNYHSDSTRNAGDWIELLNYGNAPLDLSGWKMTDGTVFNNFIFPPNSTLQPQQRIVLVNDSTAFRTQHPAQNYFGFFDFSFSNAGERVRILDNNNTVILEMNYLDSLPWPIAADGYGRTLELLQDTLDPNLPQNWFAGCVGGSPGQPYSPCNQQIIISEINYNSNSAKDAGDWLEFYNTTTADLDISGWYFSDEDDTHQYFFPQGTVIPPASYLVLYNDLIKFNGRFPLVTNKTGPFNFGMSSAGEALRIFDSNGILHYSVVYDDSSPWPTDADGNGYTLEMIDFNGIHCNADNWRIGCEEGSPGTYTILPCGATSVDAVAPEPDFSVYPNPNNGKFMLELLNYNLADEITEVIIYNTIGETVFRKSWPLSTNKLELDLSFVAKGMYFLNLYNNGKVETVKIIIQ